MDRNKVLTILRLKAKELECDTTIADSVMGVGTEIRILDELIKEKLNTAAYSDFILAINTNSPNLEKSQWV